jgi:hypothetical protein
VLTNELARSITDAAAQQFGREIRRAAAIALDVYWEWLSVVRGRRQRYHCDALSVREPEFTRPSPEIRGAFCGAEIPLVCKPCSTDQAYTAPLVLRLRAARFHKSERERDKRPKRGRDRREQRVPLFSSMSWLALAHTGGRTPCIKEVQRGLQQRDRQLGRATAT